MTQSDTPARPRDLDAAVAVRVLGWADVRPHEGDCHPSCIDGTTGLPPRDPRAGRDGVRHHLPYYSTSLEAAWGLLEGLRTRGCWVRVCGDKEGWSVTLGVAGRTERADESAVPPAACRAALALAKSGHLPPHASEEDA